MARVSPPVSPSPSQTSISALQVKSMKDAAQQLSPAQLLMKAIQTKSQAPSMSPSQVLLLALQPKSVVESAIKISHSNVCEALAPKDGPRKAEESSRALKELLVISKQVVSSTPSKFTYSQSVANTPSKNDEKMFPAVKIVGKGNSFVSQKEKKSKLSKERSKSRSNSEDAEFYAGSAILSSPNPSSVPLPNFDESSDFFSTENRYHVVEYLDDSFLK